MSTRATTITVLAIAILRYSFFAASGGGFFLRNPTDFFGEVFLLVFKNHNRLKITSKLHLALYARDSTQGEKQPYPPIPRGRAATPLHHAPFSQVRGYTGAAGPCKGTGFGSV